MFDDRPESPGDVLQRMLGDRGWTHEEFATITNRTRPAITEIISGRRGITPETATAFAAALGTTPEFWFKLDSDYKLSRLEVQDVAVIQKRARLFDIAPIKDMQRRGWIKPTKLIDELEQELRGFFGVQSLDRPPEFPVALRKSSPLAELTPPQRAWCFRARQIAIALQIPPFDGSKIGQLIKEMRILAAYPAESRRVPEVMRQYGIRFMIIEPLPGSKLDGAAFWIDENKPAIALSVRIDRLDYFWFTVMHELSHIQNRDALSVDSDLGAEERGQPLMKDMVEGRADGEAAASLILPEEIESFIRRVGPIYAKPNIIQFAHRIKIHPGIIVGQLQHRGEIGFNSHREMLPKIRKYIACTAMTDGWGHNISPDTL
jgi:HTH-type transcriptional regulator/antitoxin HigA